MAQARATVTEAERAAWVDRALRAEAEAAALRADIANLIANERRDQSDISELTLENARLREQVQRLIEQHGTCSDMGYKSELKGL